MPSTDSPWAWVPQVFQLGFWFTFVEGLSAAEMIATCGVDPAGAEVMTLQEAYEEFEGDTVFRTGETAGWGFLLEQIDGDDRGERVRELSAGRRAVLAMWMEVEDAAGLDEYEDGRHVRSFRPDAHEEANPDREEVLVAPTLAQAVRSGEALTQRAWNLVAAETLDLLTAEYGIRLDRGQVEGPLLTGEPEVDVSWLDER